MQGEEGEVQGGFLEVFSKTKEETLEGILDAWGCGDERKGEFVFLERRWLQAGEWVGVVLWWALF